MTPAQHKSKASHNEAFVASINLSTSPFLDWAATGVFYAGLHYIRALASANSFSNVTTYAQLDRLFVSLAPLKRRPDLYVHYRFLKDESREARYGSRPFKPRAISMMLTKELLPIKTYVLSLVP